jgi:hypothetical protein
MPLNRTITGAVLDITRAANGDRERAIIQLHCICFVGAWAGLITTADRDRMFELWLKYGRYNLPASDKHTILRVMRERIDEGLAMKLVGKSLLPTG